MEDTSSTQSNGALNAAWSRMFVIVNEATKALAPSFTTDEQENNSITSEVEDQESSSSSGRRKRARIENEVASNKLKHEVYSTPTASETKDIKLEADETHKGTRRSLRSSKRNIASLSPSGDGGPLSNRSQPNVPPQTKSSDIYNTQNLRRSRRIINGRDTDTVITARDSELTDSKHMRQPERIKSTSRVARRKCSLNNLMSDQSAKGLQFPSGEESHPELLTPLLSSHVGRAGLRAHIMMLRTECIQKVARPLLSRLMSHQNNRGLFNEPVDTTVILDYLSIVKDPIDLGTIKGRLLSFEYDQLEPFIGDVRRVFNNALKYNPPNNHVYNAAKLMLDELDDELSKLQKKLLRDESRRNEHHCQLCQGHECGLCGEKCLKLEPVMLMCNGPCNQRIKRSSIYFITRDGARIWCAKCHTGLGSVLPPTTSFCGDVEVGAAENESTPQLFYKRDLLKRIYDEDIPEPWVKCDECQDWFHQPCALYNRFYEETLDNGAEKCSSSSSSSGCRLDGIIEAGGERREVKSSNCFICPLCRLGPEASRIPPPWVHRARDTNFSFAHAEETTQDKSLPTSSRTVKTNAQQQPSLVASSNSAVSFSLPSATASAGHEIDTNLGGCQSPLMHGYEGGNGSIATDVTTDESWDGSESDSSAAMDDSQEIRWDAPSLPTTHMTNFIEKKVRQRLREMGHAAVASSVHIRLITSMDRCFAVGDSIQSHFKLPNGDTLPETVGYKCKSFAMFQQQDGADICLFCMYVQEYNDLAPLPNRRSVYISYLDSVEYFRPRTNDSSLRTAVYQEIIISYLAWIRQRGFEKAHLWSCPPQRGNNFIFWCHPQHQRTPNKERLIMWYQNMVHVARMRGVVTHVSNFYDEYFKPTLGDLVSHSSKKALSLADLQERPEKKLTKKGRRMLNMAKIGRNGRGRGRNGWKGRATYGLDSNTILAARGTDVGVGHFLDGIGSSVDNLGDANIINHLKIETIEESQNSSSLEEEPYEESEADDDDSIIQFIDADEETCSSSDSKEKEPDEKEDQKTSSSSSTDALRLCPPLFEGDYWIEEAYRLYSLKNRKKVTLDEGNKTAFQIATSFVRSLRQHNLSLAFNQPVDPIALQIPDYLDVVKQPMDLSTIAKKLKNREYQLVSDMLKDIDLTFDNAQLYNPPKHPVHAAAASLKTYYQREWKVLCDRWKEKQHLVSEANTAKERAPSTVCLSGLNQESLQLKSSVSFSTSSTMCASDESSTSFPASMISNGDPSSHDSDGQRHLRSGYVSTVACTDKQVPKKKRNSSVENIDAHNEEDVPHISLVRSISLSSTASTSSFGGENEGEFSNFATSVEQVFGGEENSDDSCSNGVFNLTNASDASSICGGNDSKSMMQRLQEQHWLMRDVGKSVYKLRGDLLVLHLTPSAAPNHLTRRASKKAWDFYVGKDNHIVADLLSASHIRSSSSAADVKPCSKEKLYLSFNDNDPDPHHVSRPLMDGRHTMLEVSMFKHLQFDTLRRAKHATSLLLYYLHFPSHSLLAKCCRCSAVLEGLRWHCSICTDYDICGECNTALDLSCPSRHPLTPYHVSSFD